MTDHHPLQMELAIREAAVGVAAKRLADLQARKHEVNVRVHELANVAGEARGVLRSAAGSHAAGEGDQIAVTKARKAVKEAESEAELAGIELEGIDEHVQLAERDLAGKRRDRNLIATDICMLREPELVARTLSLWDALARSYRAIYTNRRTASHYASDAANRYSEPIEFSSETCGLLRRNAYDEGYVAILGEHGISARLTPMPNTLAALTPAELLEIELPKVERAAAE